MFSFGTNVGAAVATGSLYVFLRVATTNNKRKKSNLLILSIMDT